MNLKKFFNWEDSVKKWIENNRGKWIFTLGILGLFLGLMASLLLGASSRTQFIMSTGYACLLPVIELFCGGAGS